MAKKKKKEISPNTLAVAGTALATSGVALVRKKNLKNVDPNKILVRGGAVTDKGKNVSTVFNTQRKAWSEALRGQGAAVEEAANYVVNEKGKYKPTTKTLTKSTPGKPIAELHVGAHPKKSPLGIAMGRLAGKTQYRVFSDFGPGNLESGRKYLGGKNWMRAPKSPVYDRNIVPGGDILKTRKAAKPNINMESIPTSKTFSEASKVIKPTGKSTKILLSAGTGFVWPKTLPKGTKDLETVYKAISKAHPKHQLTILGGPHVGKYGKILKTFAETNKKRVKYVGKTDLPGMRDLYKSHQVSIMAPGSTTAEIAAMKGHKPKILGLGLAGEKHFKHNTEWFNRRVGGAEYYDLKKGYSEKGLAQALGKLKDKKAPSRKSVTVSTGNIKNIMETAKADFKAKKVFTKRLGRVGGATAAIGGVLALKDLIKKAAKKDELTKTILPVSAAGVGIRALENKLHDIKSRKVDFVSPQEVKNYYKGVRAGDVIMLKDKFTRGVGHPLLVTDAQNYYDWPSAEGWKKGLKSKKVVKGSKVTPDRPHRLKGKIMEAYPGDKVVRSGSLQGKLTELSTVQEPHINVKGKKSTRARFDRRVSRELGGIYRQEGISQKKLKANIKILESNAEKGLYKYRPFSKKFKLAPGCAARGNCVTFAKGVLNASTKAGVKTTKMTSLPGQFAKGLKQIKPSRTPTMGKTNYLTPLLALEGGLRIKRGIEKGDAKQTAIGAVEVGAGAAINISKKLNAAVNNLGGYVSQTVGGIPIEGTANIIDKVKKSKSHAMLETSRQFLRRNPGVSKGVGAALLTLPAVYGLKKGVDWIQDNI